MLLPQPRHTRNYNYSHAETLTGFLTAAELPSLNLYATRYGLTLGPPAALSGLSFTTMGRPKKSTAACAALKARKRFGEMQCQQIMPF